MLNILRMPRVYLGLVMIALVALVVVALLTHSQSASQPYDERRPRAFLMPVNCSAPCILGLRPGVTSMTDAITMLRQHKWVEQVTVMPNETKPHQVFWTWNESAPDFLQRGNDFSDGSLSASGGSTVSSIGFDSTLTMGDIPKILGDPMGDGFMFSGVVIPPDPKMYLDVEFWYASGHLTVSVRKPCPYNKEFESMTTQISVTEVDMSTAMRTSSIEPVAQSDLLTSLHRYSQQVCGF